MKALKSALLTTVLAAGLAAPASAGERVKLGMLDCVVEGGVNFALVSSRTLECSFFPTFDGQATESYSGRIEKFGLDLGQTQNTLMRWAVIAPTANGYSEGALAGNYGGATASASFVVGLGANVLIGGLEKSIALQPVSVQSQEGINLAVGVASLRLDAAN
ncbi:DUF992 domain-containing protein [Oricola sp.]|uniref:DUF992 domain-containing protein n=1 Tax=Oricola sp. TaxID=1979950 RepID=UPI0025D363AB|nr:DUF992 domain-containing protein [Oricola sp.]MCI5075682.1 DUF992 domain-containing protein [Oricola sp.]